MKKEEVTERRKKMSALPAGYDSREAPEECQSVYLYMSQRLMRRAIRCVYEDIHKSRYHYQNGIGIKKDEQEKSKENYQTSEIQQTQTSSRREL
ncbi:hypothetical protein F8M41_003408 [Gigaspora margarita]|uniref:Uncharacterized protein n=1 Tax=Gigaspora margarita TaxID=4874 RepID=A0A8H4B4N7_GIGMA|nr:hypothetical protein F8M41_003408 [Gigaspora margarita]